MIDCMVLGDSIAVGVQMVRRECFLHAKSGINSQRWNKEFLNQVAGRPTKTLIISLGANDHGGVKTEGELRRMRQNITGQRVFWIDPGKDRKPIQHDAIVRIAQEYGDIVLPRPKEHMSADGVHPTMTGYRELAEKTK